MKNLMKIFSVKTGLLGKRSSKKDLLQYYTWDLIRRDYPPYRKLSDAERMDAERFGIAH